MLTSDTKFNSNKINYICPYFILVDSNLEIQTLGESFKNHFGNGVGVKLHEICIVKELALKKQSFLHLKKCINNTLTLVLKRELGYKELAGYVEFLEATNQLLFLVYPLEQSVIHSLNNKIANKKVESTTKPVTENNHVLLNNVNNSVSGVVPINEITYANFAFNNIDSGILFLDTNGCIVFVNNAFCKMLGENSVELHSTTISKLLKKELTNTDALVRIHNACENGYHFTENIQFLRKDGSSFWAKINGKVFNSDVENTYNYIVYVDDITYQKQKDQRLKAFSQIVDNNTNPVIITNKLGKIEWVNRSFISTTGYSYNEQAGRFLYQLFDKNEVNLKLDLEIKKKIKNEESFSVEVYCTTKNGAPYWVHMDGCPIHDDTNFVTGYFVIGKDITNEKHAKSATLLTELKFWIALEKIYENAWEHDFVKSRTYFSKSNTDFWGYTNNDQAGNDNIWWESIHKDDLHLLENTHAKYLAKEIDSHNLEYRIYHKNGTIKWVMDRGVVLERDKDGKPLRTIGTHTDITQNKLTETELEQRVKQFKSLSENIPGVIYEYEFRSDGSEGFRYVSPAIKRLFGINPDNLNNYFNYLSPTDKARIKQKNEYSRNNLQSYYDEAMINVPSAGAKWLGIFLSFSYISQNGAKVFTGFIMDITEQKSKEDILRTNEEKYRSIIANMNLGLIEIDNNSNIVYTNNSFCDMSGYSAPELIGKGINTFFPLEKNKGLLRENSKQTNDISDAYQVKTTNKHGSTNWWLVSGAPRFNDNGIKLGYIGIFLDITEQKKLELALILAREQAEQSAKTKEIFLANMSHEMRTPMNAVIGMSNQLGKTKLDSRQRFYLDTVHSAADNLLMIINDILDLSKIEAGKLSLENIGFEPRVLLQKTIQILAHKAQEKGLELLNSYFDKQIAKVLLGDNYRLSQVLLNLVSNAIKFTEKGTVDISFKLAQNKSTSQSIIIEVTDTGIGMDAYFIERLFDKFSQEYESVSRKFGGTGLGMSICKELILLMGGDISAKSQKGHGTTITITLTLNKGKKSQLPKEYDIQIDNQLLYSKKILLADDNDLNRLVTSMILKDYGAIIYEASNGFEAIDIFNKHECDIILMDIQMPELNGYDTSVQLRKIGCTIPIIALTANAIKGEREKCIALGMNDYIAKPFKEKELLSKIANWLNLKVVIVGSKKKPKAPVFLSHYNFYKLKKMSSNKVFVKEMVEMFCEQTPEMLENLISAYKSNNFDGMSFYAHKMRSSIDSFDIQVLKKVIKDIEAIGCGKQEDNGDLPQLIDKVNTVIKEVIIDLNKRFKI